MIATGQERRTYKELLKAKEKGSGHRASVRVSSVITLIQDWLVAGV